MKFGYKQLTAAFALSAFAHVAVASLFQPVEPAVEIAGGSPSTLALAGNSFADMMMAGEAVDTLEAVTEPAMDDAVDASDETAMTSAVTEPAAVAEAVEVAPPASAVDTSTLTESPAAETVRPVEAQTEAVSEIEAVAEVAAVDADVAIAAPPPSLQEEAPDPVADMEIPVPVARPAPRPQTTASAPEPVQPAKAKTPRKPKAAARAKPQPGNGGKSSANANQGGSAAATGNSSRAGNAAVSNYPGKVASRLRRALRYPGEAKAQRIRGEAIVGFVVASGGSVSAIRLVRSSGSSLLDAAAIDTVRRAAPFPPIPGGAGRSSWPFSVPVSFNR